MYFRANQLRYFVAVVDEGQITRAARKLHIAQPALSSAVRKLEEQVGVPLLIRHPRGVEVTQAGALLVEKARAVVEAEAHAEQFAMDHSEGLEGGIAFGTVGFPPWQVAPLLTEAFTAARPRVELRPVSMSFPTQPIAEWLATVDVAISTPVTPDPNVWVQYLRADARVLLAAKSGPYGKRDELSVAEVAAERFIGQGREVDPLWAGSWSLDEERGGPSARLSKGGGSSMQANLALVAAGRAVTTAPARQAKAIVAVLPGVVAIPLRDARPVTTSLIGRNDRTNRFVEALREVASGLSKAATSEGPAFDFVRHADTARAPRPADTGEA